MSIPILVFSDSPLPQAVLEKRLFTYHVISSIDWEKQVASVPNAPETKFILSCGATHQFVAFSQLWKQFNARLLLTLGDSAEYWIQRITPLPFQISRRWLHRSNLDGSKEEEKMIYKCLIHANNSNTKAAAIGFGSQQHQDHGAWGSSRALISVFTSTFHSGETKLRRAVESMLSQTYNDWEWVIVDDSKNDETTRVMLKRLAEQDLRIRHYDLSHSGFIGEAKWRAAALCRGEWLVELDHDDRIMPSLLQTIIEIGQNKPDIGVIFSDFTTIGVDDKEVEFHRYWKSTTAFGTAGYMCKYWRGQWHPWYLSSPLNNLSLTDIVGVPNHVRSFKRELYHSIGGYNYDFSIADDYDLMLRLFMSGAPWARIAEPLYLQYENVGGDNFTNHRITQIRELQSHLSMQYWPCYQTKYQELSSAKHQHPTLLQKARFTEEGEEERACYDMPQESRLKLEYTWQNGKLYSPQRTAEGASAVHGGILRLHSKPKIAPVKQEVLVSLLQMKEVTVLLLVNATTNIKHLRAWLLALKSIKQSTYIIGHPDCILRALQRNQISDPNADLEAASLELRDFFVWSFGLEDDGYYKNGYESWQKEEYNVVQHHLANYGLKLTCNTAYVMYLDASVAPTSDIQSLIDASQSHTASTPNQADLPLFGTVLQEGVPDTTVMHGFVHHSTIPELYGYWPLDGCTQKDVVQLWRDGATKLQDQIWQGKEQATSSSTTREPLADTIAKSEQDL